MAKLSAEATLEAVTTGLTKLSEFTEAVKTFVEKSDATASVPTDEWTKTVQSFAPWMTDVLATLDTKETVVETPAKVEDEEKVVVAAETVTATETVVAPAATETVTTTTETPVVAASTETVVAPVTTETVTTTTETPAVETVTTTTATPAEVIDGVAKAAVDLAATTPTVEGVKKVLALADRLFVSGGLFIDTYDVEALAMVCNAICASMYDETEPDAASAMTKAAEKITAEISKRTVAVAKRVAKATTTTATDGKELKVVSMLLKSLEDAFTAKTSTTATETTVDTAAIQKMVNDAVALATKDFTAQTATLKQQITKLETDKADLSQKLTTALATPETRASSQETVAKGTTPAKPYGVNRNGIVDYNEPN